MPIYEYRCDECDYEYEQRRSMADMDSPSDCPKCDKAIGERQVSMSFAVVGASGGAGDFDFGDLGGMEGMEGLEGMGGMPPGMDGMPPDMGAF